MKLKGWAAGMAAIVAAAAVPSAGRACELAPPEQMISAEDELRRRAEFSDVIASAIVTKRGRSAVPFKLLHVYKGALKPGARLKLRPAILGCPTGEKPWPTEKGTTGVISVSGGEFLFLRPDELELMFQKGWVPRPGR